MGGVPVRFEKGGSQQTARSNFIGIWRLSKLTYLDPRLPLPLFWSIVLLYDFRPR
jgi:hypothetical protein